LRLLDHLADDFGWVLQVAVHHDDPLRSGGAHPLDDSHAQAVAPLGRPLDHGDVRRDLGTLGADDVRRVVRAVIHEDDFEVDALERALQSVEQRLDVAGLITGGDDN